MLQGLAVVAVGALLGVAAGATGAAIGAAVSAVLGLAYGQAVAIGRMYRGPGGGIRCLVDAIWSALNTWAGALFYGFNRVVGNRHSPEQSSGTGAIWVDRKVKRRYATTIGPVKAGSSDRIDPHEQVHVFQARLFGPLYLPLVALNYVVATVLPYWLLFRHRRPITGFRSYFEDGVYPHVWNELWAHRVTRRPR